MPDVLLSDSPSYAFEAGFLTEPGTKMVSFKLQRFSFSVCLITGVTPGFIHGSWEPNSGLHADTASTLASVPPQQTLWHFVTSLLDKRREHWTPGTFISVGVYVLP